MARKKITKAKKPAAKKRPAKKPAKKKSAAKKPSKKKVVSKKKQAPAGDQIGEVVAFFRIPVVAVIKIKRGSIRVGDQIWIKGHTTDLKQTVSSMQINHQPIQQAGKGDEFGLKISSRARRGDHIYRITP